MSTLQNKKQFFSHLLHGRLINTLVFLFAMTLITACGGGGGGDTSNVNTGTFIDAPVQGLDYLTATQSGITDSQGSFKCETGEEITFSLGDVVLGTTLCKSVITPLDLVPGALDETDHTVTNILRLLQSLDDDCDLDNTIYITQQIASEVSGRPIIFDTSVEDFGNGAVADLFDALNGLDLFNCNDPIELRSAEEAQGHFREVMDGAPIELAATFSITPETIIVSEPVVFDASESTGNITEYAWDFGDGSSGSGVKASHTYAETGSYIVTLAVTDDSRDKAESSEEIVVIVPPNQPPVVSYTPNPTSGMAPLFVSFIPTATDPDGTITNYFWDFGDGSSINARIGSHIYQQPGTYLATLTVTYNDGAETAVSAEVVVNEPPPNQFPTASFTAAPETGEAVLQVFFNASSSSDPDGTISSFSWDFGDGQTGAGATKNHSFSNAGTYQVRLTVTDNDGATAEATAEIIVTEPINIPPTASFTTTPTSGNAPLTVNFNGSASSDTDGTIEQYSWNFGDGQSGSGRTASHTYSEPGTYQATLTVTDDDGAAAETTTEVVVTEQTNQAPIASFTVSTLTGEAPLVVKFNANDSSDPDGTIIEYHWNYGNGIGAFGIRGTNKYESSGTFQVVLTVTDNEGAQNTAVKTITVKNTINSPPVASFTATPDSGQAPLNVLFYAAASADSDGTITSFNWNFDDGQTGSGYRVNHTFDTPGNYQVQLTVTDNDGSTGTKNLLVNVLDQTNQPPTASFTATPGSGAAPLDVEFDASPSTDPDGTITGYFWDLGDGQIATTATVSHTYSVADSYQVHLTVTDDDGAADTTTMDITATTPSIYSVSGTIQAPDNTAVDSDVRDSSAPNISNDTEATAQLLANPVVLGGFASSSSDESDYYLVDLAAGQQITLNIVESAADLDLFYENKDTEEVGSSEGTTQTESFTVPTDGSYLISVLAYGGSSNYIMTISQPTAAGIIASQAIGTLHLQSDFNPGEIIIKFKEDAKSGGPISLADGATATGLRAKRGKPGRPMLFGIDVKNREKTIQTLGFKRKRVHPFRKKVSPVEQLKIDTIDTIKALRQRTDVLYAEPNYLRKPLAAPNDPHYSLQWHYPYINLPQAWDFTTGSSSVVVAVIDTGVLVNHPDLQGQLTPGYDFISVLSVANDGDGIDPDPDDPGDLNNPDGTSSFHGTHVAGTIAARTNNNTGVAGIAWNAKVMPLRALGVGGGWSFDIREAMEYAARMENDSGTLPSKAADIINLSIGGEGSLQSEQDFFNELHDVHNIIVVAAAGNNSSSTLFYPASYDNVVSVSAIDMNGDLAYYSNYGSRIDVAAPGGGDTPDLNGDGYYDGVLSTVGDDSGIAIQYLYAFFQGTSMATPHVSGVAALMKSVFPDLTPQQFDNLLASGSITDDIGSPGRDNQFGYGLINALSAVVEAEDLGGGGSTSPANLVINPASLNFGSALSSLTLSAQNSGTETLQVAAPTVDQGWLSVTSSSVNADGLGTYTATVNRSSLADGTYTATITFPTTANEVEINVIMQVQSVATAGNLGRLYVKLLDPDTYENVKEIGVNATNGNYNYTLTNVSAGTYILFAGSDPNGNGEICGDGEACGAYLTLAQPNIITVDSNLSGMNFGAQYNIDFSLGSFTLTTDGFRELKKKANGLETSLP